MGLPLKHPVVILNGIALMLSIFYVVIMVSLHIPSGLHPYFTAIAGSLAAGLIAIAVISRSSGKAGLVVGYALTAENLFLGGGFALSAISYFTGPNSILWHLTH